MEVLYIKMMGKYVNSREYYLVTAVVISLVVFGFAILWLDDQPKLGYAALVIGAVGSWLLFDFHLQRGDKVSSSRAQMLLIVILLALSFILRLSLFEHATYDFYLIASWYGEIERLGVGEALATKISIYPPLYMYLLAAIGNAPLKLLWSLKLLSVVFDYIAAGWIYKIVKVKYPNGMGPAVAALTVLFAPTVLINGSLWAQSDVIFTSFLLGGLYYMVRLVGQGEQGRRDKYMALLLVGLALALKPQAIFFVLPIVLWYVTRRVQWYQLLVIPLVYVVVALPSYLLGRSVGDLAGIYTSQISFWASKAPTAPSVYHLIPLSFEVQLYPFAAVLGMVLVVSFAAFCLSRRVRYSAANLVRVAMLSVIAVPYVMPGMHERYFFAADVMAIVFAWYFPKYWYLPVVVGGLSLLSYSRYLTGQQIFDGQVLAVVMGLMVVLVARDFILKCDTE